MIATLRQHAAVVEPAPAELVALRSRARIADFRLHVPASIGEALALKARYPDAWFMAGGIDVANRLKTGAPVADMIHLGRVPALGLIGPSADGLVVGAAVSHDAMATSKLVADACPDLARIWGRIANPRVRFKGTIGGNIMADEPGYEALAILGAVDARLWFTASSGPLRLTVDQHLTSPRLGVHAAAILDGVIIPYAATRRLVYDRSLKGIAGVVVSTVTAQGRFESARAAVTWAFRRPIVAAIPGLEGMTAADLCGRAGEIAAAWCTALPAPIEDHLASAAYRRRMIEVQLRRGLAALAAGVSS